MLCVNGEFLDTDMADRAIIDLLQQNARATLAEIAAHVDLSPSAVKRRIGRLEQHGVIKGYTVIVDDSRLGRPLEAFTELTFVGNTKVADIAAVADGLAEVEAIFTTAGDPDALVWIRVRDVAHLTSVIDKLRRTGTVTGTKTLMVLDTWRPHLAGQRPSRAHY